MSEHYDPIAPIHGFTHQKGGDDPLPLTIWDLYEVGDIHITMVMPNPIPDGWELMGENRVLIGAGDTYEPEDTGGSISAGPLTHDNMFIYNHAPHHHTNPNEVEQVVQSGAGASVVGLTGDTGDPTAVLTHSWEPPQAHSAFSILPPFIAVYFFRKVA